MLLAIIDYRNNSHKEKNFERKTLATRYIKNSALLKAYCSPLGQAYRSLVGKAYSYPLHTAMKKIASDKQPSE